MGDRRVAVAYSGGRDSTALLHATLQAAAPQGVEVHALHVHHGLTGAADAWLRHCQDQCRRWSRRGLPVHFQAHRVEQRPRPGDSVEAWARQARYQALAQMARAGGISLVLLAHHRRDQAETLMLQALRGAGVPGLSGMPRSVERAGVTWVRPWLDRPREDIEAYVRRHRLRCVEDPSNQDPRFARNRLRLRVWPALVDAFEQAEAALAASAEWAQEARAALEELAEQDLSRVAPDAGLQVRAWSELSAPRRANVLRAWIKRRTGAHPSAALMRRLRDELAVGRPARWPTPSGELQLHRGVLRYAPPVEQVVVGPPLRETLLGVDRAATYELPGWGGRLLVQPTATHGVPLAWLARLELRERLGGERFQSGISRPPRSLKKQYQDRGVPAWDREGPLLYSGGQLVYVPALGLDARVLGMPGQSLVTLHWQSLSAAA